MDNEENMKELKTTSKLVNFIETSSIIEKENYNVILVPLKGINKKATFIYPNVLSMLNYKDIIDSAISRIDESINIDFFKLFHLPTDESGMNQNIIEIKKYSFTSNNYSQELIETWISDNSEDIDTIDDIHKNNNFELALSTVLTTDINDVIVFGHNNSIYESLMLNNNIISDKHIIYISFDSNNNNMYDLYVNKNHKYCHNYGQLYNDINTIFPSEIKILIPPVEKPSTANNDEHDEQQNDIYTYKPIILSINNLLNTVEDVQGNKYYCFIMFKKKNVYTYKIQKYVHLNQSNITLNDITYNQLMIKSVCNLLLDSSNEYLVDNIDKITDIYNGLTFTGLSKKYLELQKNILNKYTDVLNLQKNKFIDVNKLELKTNKFNIIELLQNFAKNGGFNFGSIKKQIKQNKNIIKNFTSVVKCQEDIIKWELLFNSFVVDNISSKNNLFDFSCDLYNLLLSRTTWYEELLNGNITGLLIHLITPKLAKLGIIMDKIKILEISNNLITLEQICEAQDIYMTDKKIYDDGRSNSFAIYGNALGNGNCILPLYLNEIHWTLVKPQLRYTMGIAINQNPFDYYNKHLEIYPMTLLSLSKNMVSDRNSITDKHIITFIQLSITVSLIFKDYFKYNINKKSIDELSESFSEPFNRTEQSFDNLDCLLGFTILSNNKNISNKINSFKNNNLQNVFTEELRRRLKHSYATHTPFEFNDIFIDIDNIWTYFTDLCCAEDYDKKLYLDLIIHLLKHTYDLNNFDKVPLIFKNLLNDNVVESINKITIWSLLSKINNHETVLHLNNVINDKFGFITPDTIQYFKNIFIRLNTSYKTFEENDNKLLFLNITDDYKLRFQTFILQNIATRDKKYFLQNYMFNPLTDKVDCLIEYYVSLTKSFINRSFNCLPYHNMNITDQQTYIQHLVDIINDTVSVFSNESNKLQSLFNSFLSDTEFNNHIKHNISNTISCHIFTTKNNIKHVIVNAISCNLINIPNLLSFFKLKIDLLDTININKS